MEYALDSLHADGIALLSTQNGVYMGDSAFREVYAEMSRRSAVVFIHPARPTYALPLKLGPSLIEYTFETTRVAVNLIYNDIVPRYPNKSAWPRRFALGARDEEVCVPRPQP